MFFSNIFSKFSIEISLQMWKNSLGFRFRNTQKRKNRLRRAKTNKYSIQNKHYKLNSSKNCRPKGGFFCTICFVLVRKYNIKNTDCKAQLVLKHYSEALKISENSLSFAHLHQMCSTKSTSDLCSIQVGLREDFSYGYGRPKSIFIVIQTPTKI